MLARVARRKLRKDAFKPQPPAAEQLTLPWLCPAHMRWAASVSPVNATSTYDSRQHLSPTRRVPSSVLPRHETRSLATTTDLTHTPQSAATFHGLVQAWGSRKPDPELSKLRPWDTSQPLVVHDVLSCTTLPTTPVKYGVGGDPIELHQNLYACLRVGRMERATAIIDRLTQMYNPAAPEVVDAHNAFLETMFEQAQENPSPTVMTEMEGWYDAKMIRKGIQPNAQTIVMLLRAAMVFLEPRTMENTVRKYLSLANDLDPALLDEVNSSSDFSDEEWDTLIRFQPDIFKEPPSVDEVQGMHISTPGGQALAIQHGLIPDPSLFIKPVSQKGLGLSSLKKALALFEPGEHVAYPDEMQGSVEEKDRAYAYMRQLRLEQDATDAAVERWKAEDAKLQEIGIHGVLQSKPIQALMWNWYSALVPLLQEEIRKTKEVLSSNSTNDSKLDERHIYGPYLEQCSAEQLAAIGVSRLLFSCTRGARDDANSLKLTTITTTMGKDIEDAINGTVKARHRDFLRKVRRRTRKDLLTKLSKEKASINTNVSSSATTSVTSDTSLRKSFPLHVKTKLGAIVLDNIFQSAMITVTRNDPKTSKQLSSTQRAFHHHSGFVHGKRVGWIAPHHELMVKLRSEDVHSIQVQNLPMLVEPKPWSSFTDGGYYTAQGQAVRTKTGDNAQKTYAISAIENGDMDKILAGLDVLGRVPWKINSDILRVMAEAWNSGEGVAGLVPENSGLQRPADPSPNASSKERARWNRQMKEYENHKGGLHSQRCFQNFQLEVARAFQNEKFYYPHSVDFRGRAYPVPPILNHIGADFSRGLLKFGNGKELGTVGLQWLKVHLANLYGFDKASLRDREQFAMDNLTEIYDSATNPLGGNRWWTKAEDPWQCLACCMELKNALDSPDPTRFISHLPVHQDGTCNGLQHYAALGGDEAGANQVNLEPSDRPQDIYTGVAELVKEMVSEDSEKGHIYAKFIDGKITRRVVKRTVMTNVYGVTYVGAKLQVWDELKDIFPDHIEGDGSPPLALVAMYVASKIFVALGKIFNGAQEIQYWLGECGDRITTSLSAQQICKIQGRYNEGKEHGYDAKYKPPKNGISDRLKKKFEKDSEAFKTPIIWTTPLKMPVVQPYRKETTQVVRTNIQNITVARTSGADVVDKRKQLQAFPPNFIHSLDATHMILSALKCSELGLDFAAVHDSFWTHAGDIPNLNIVLRDAFVRMHSEDIVGRLAAEFKARYAGAMYCAKLKAHSPVTQEIMQWRRKNKGKGQVAGRNAPFSEVALEAKRQELLNSKSNEDRKKGEAMVTPTSIWLKHSDPRSLNSFRLALLGDTKGKKLAEAKEKVLGAEAKALRQETAKAEANQVQDDHTVEKPAEMAINKSTEFGAEPNKEALEVKAEPESTAAPKEKHSLSNVNVWLPLTFPPIPNKGSWDVKRLRESKYFFS